MPEQTRYLLDSDDDGHWYLIPEAAHSEFTSWVYSAAEGELRPEPDGVLSLGSHPNTVTFEAPEHLGKAVA